ncbi:hypothetical protein [Pseudomonas rhizophila]
MSHNFKPGELAMIIGYSKSAANLGKSCELVAFLHPGERADLAVSGFDGVRHTGDKPGWLVAGGELVATSGTRGFTIVLEKNLMPLKGDFSQEQQKSRELIA